MLLKRFWLLTTLILLTTTASAHGLIAFTQALPPYYNCVHLRDVQVSLNRHLNYVEDPSVIYSGVSPDGKWRIRQEFDEIISLENIDTGRKIPLKYDLNTSSAIYWSPDSTIFTVVPYRIPSDSQQRPNAFKVVFVSVNGDELANYTLETSTNPLVIGWSSTSQYFAMRTHNSNFPQRDWIFSAPNFTIQQFDPPFNEIGETDYRTKSFAWSHAADRLVILFGNSLLLVDPAHSQIALTPIPPLPTSNNMGYRYNYIVWSPNDRYVAIVSHDDMFSGDPDQNQLYVVDTQDSILNTVSSFTYRVELLGNFPLGPMLFWGSESTLYYLESPDGTDNPRDIFQLTQLDIETGQRTPIYSNILAYQFEVDDIRIFRQEGNQRLIERLVNDQWLPVYSAPSDSIVEVKFLPTATFIHQDENGWYRTHIVSNDGLSRYVSPPNVASYLENWRDYILIFLSDAPYIRFEIVDPVTLNAYRPPESLVAQFNDDSLVPYTFYVNPAPNGQTLFVSFYGNGFFLSLENNQWQMLYRGRRYLNGSWSPDSKRIILNENHPNYLRQLSAFEIEDGHEWDMGYFHQESRALTFDQCADLITILRNT